MSIVFDIDAVVDENRPVVKLRGKEFEIKDMTVKEMLVELNRERTKLNQIEQKQKSRIREELEQEGFEDEKEIEKEVNSRLKNMSEEERFEDFLDVALENLEKILVGFDRQKFEDLSMREFKAVQAAIDQSQNVEYKPEGKKNSGKQKK